MEIESKTNEDFCVFVLSKFNNPTNERHIHICSTIGTISQELKDQKLPLTPFSYFCATCSSLDHLLSSTVDPPIHTIDALLTVLSLVIHKINFPSVLDKKYEYLSELLLKVVGVKIVGVKVVEGVVKFALPLLTVRHNVGWNDVSRVYGVLVGYMTDERSQVRKQSNMCISQVLQTFGSVPNLKPLLTPASEAITNVFERFLLLAGGSNVKDPEGPKGAQEVLYVLDTFKSSLPFMSCKSLNKILKHFKSLLEVRQSVVTRRITDALDNLCRHNREEVNGEALVELLCSLAAMISPSESYADSMTFTARLLGNGMKQVYSLDRQICVVKLPVVLSALTDILTSGHEEALVEAANTYKNLIRICVDQSLIEQGVDQIRTNVHATRKSGPTVIEKICATTESLLDYQYEAIWDVSFQIVSTMFEKLGKYSFYFLKEGLKNLADIQKLPDEDFTLRKQLHECVGAALGAMGPESFLTLLPLNLDAQDLSEANLWLFPILKQYTVGANLKFFADSILPLIGAMKHKSTRLNHEGNMHSARIVDGIVYSLWSLLPSFCNYPVDTTQSFKSLEKALCTALQDDSDVRGIICSSLQILIQQNKKILEGTENNMNIEVSNAEEHAIAFYTSDAASANLGVLRSSCRELLSVLSGVYFKSSSDISGVLQKTIGELADISDKKVVSLFFKKTMQKLLKVTQEAGKSANTKASNSMQVDNSSQEGSLSVERAQLLDLAVSLLPGLDVKEIDLLYVAIRPALVDVEGLIQKKAYRVLALILEFSDEFISRKLEEVRLLMVEVLPSIHFSAKRHRLDCLYFLIIHVSKEECEQRRQDITVSFLTEIILALKEANKKTRNRAYEILVKVGHAYGDEDDNGGEKGKLQLLFNMVAGGLAGETPHMISAAMTGLARLAYEFSDLVSSVYDILPSTFLLLQRKNKEIIKANLGLLKVLVAKSEAGGLHTHLRNMVECLLNWQDSNRNHFKAKVKLLLEMLVKKCGLDAVKAVMPAEHMKLLTNIRKLKERKEKKLAAKSIESRSVLSKATTSRLSRWNHSKIFSDFDDETRHSDGEILDRRSIASQQSKHSLPLRSKRKRNADKSLQEDLFEQSNDNPLDLLNVQRTRSALRSSALTRKKTDSDDEPEIDSEGRLIIHEDGKTKTKTKQKKDIDSDNDEVDGRSETRSYVSRSSKNDVKRRKTSESGYAYTGKEYASKKAGGDLKRKDKLEPYAYWPLDRKMVSKRPEHRVAARKGMAQVVKLTKRLEGRSVSSALSMKGVLLKRSKRRSGNKNA